MELSTTRVSLRLDTTTSLSSIVRSLRMAWWSKGARMLALATTYLGLSLPRSHQTSLSSSTEQAPSRSCTRISSVVVAVKWTIHRTTLSMWRTCSTWLMRCNQTRQTQGQRTSKASTTHNRSRPKTSWVAQPNSMEETTKTRVCSSQEVEAAVPSLAVRESYQMRKVKSKVWVSRTQDQVQLHRTSMACWRTTRQTQRARDQWVHSQKCTRTSQGSLP